MKKKELLAACFLVLLSVSTLVWLNYLIFYRPIFEQPRLDRTFLSKHPTRAEVLAYFQRPPEVILHKGEKFQMRGWYPMPTRTATHLAYQFSQDYNHIYIFFDADDRVEEFVIATS